MESESVMQKGMNFLHKRGNGIQPFWTTLCLWILALDQNHFYSINPTLALSGVNSSTATFFLTPLTWAPHLDVDPCTSLLSLSK